MTTKTKWITLLGRGDFDGDVLVFNTVKGSTYLLMTGGSPELMVDGKTIYSGNPNNEPKQFGEAMLGKERDF